MLISDTKVNKSLIVAALTFVAPFAFASEFDGLNLQLGIGGSNTSSRVSGTAITDSNGATYTTLDGTHSEGSFNGMTSIGYSKALGSEGFNMAGSLFYVIGNQNAGNVSSTFVGSGGSLTEAGNVKFENTWGVSIEPGWNFAKSSLGFLKLAWVNSTYKGNLSANLTSFSDPTRNATAATYGSKNLNGFGYGLGVKHMLTQNIFAAVDVLGVSYQSYENYGVSAKPSQWMGFASLGYRF